MEQISPGNIIKEPLLTWEKGHANGKCESRLDQARCLKWRQGSANDSVQDAKNTLFGIL